jgi:D-lactate dehydrogenase
MSEIYNAFLKEIGKTISKDRIYTDQLRRFAWGTDAGFYRMTPQIVVRTMSEDEVSTILSRASELKVPVTFRAAGTSLSGQAVSDSVLAVAGKNWEGMSTSDDGLTVRLQPGVVGAKV